MQDDVAIYDLKCVIAVAQEGSESRAATRLQTAQSASASFPIANRQRFSRLYARQFRCALRPVTANRSLTCCPAGVPGLGLLLRLMYQEVAPNFRGSRRFAQSAQ